MVRTSKITVAHINIKYSNYRLESVIIMRHRCILINHRFTLIVAKVNIPFAFLLATGYASTFSVAEFLLESVRVREYLEVQLVLVWTAVERVAMEPVEEAVEEVPEWRLHLPLLPPLRLFSGRRGRSPPGFEHPEVDQYEPVKSIPKKSEKQIKKWLILIKRRHSQKLGLFFTV